jgi:hypothetical protein
MSITTYALRYALRYALTAAALCAATATADAKPRRVVVLDFDGPRQLADSGKSSVLSVLGEQYDVVATKRWAEARAAAAQNTHGPAQWSRAAKQSGVDAVIEGWVQDEGRRKILNVVVREADNGREFDTISVRLDGRNGISTESSRQLQTSLDEVLDWIDAGQNEAPQALPIINVKKIGASRPAVPVDDDDGTPRPRARRPIIDDDAPAPASAASEPRTRRSKRPVAEADTTTDAPAKPATRPDETSGGPPEDERAHDAKPVEVSTAAREAHEIEILFPQGSDERKQALGEKVDHVPQKTSRFMVDAGPYYGSRSLIWNANVDANVMQYAGVTSKGIGVSPNFEVPDTKYSYLGASAHLDLQITDRTTIGFGGRYFAVLDAGDLSSADWFGPANAHGLGLEASFVGSRPCSDSSPPAGQTELW